MFCFCESKEKRLNSARSKFADASISRWIEDWAASVRNTAASFVNPFSKPRYYMERSFPALNEHVLLLWIERETAEQRPLEVCRRIDFAIDWRPRPLWSSTFLQAIQSTRDMRCIRDIDLEKVWNEVQKLKTFIFIFIFNVVKTRKISSFAGVVYKTYSISIQSSPSTCVTYDKTRFSKGAVNLKVLKPLPHSSHCQKISTNYCL